MACELPHPAIAMKLAHALSASLVSTSIPLFLGFFACSSSRTSSTRPSSAQIASAGSPSLRTLDNTGYVDPGGRTRQASQGVGPTPVGREDMVAPTQPERPSGPPGPAAEGVVPGPAGPATPAPAETSEFKERAARALCDREVYCGRLGEGKAFPTADACMVEKRERVRRALGEDACREIRGDRVSACLAAIRGASCGPGPVAPPAECAIQALCGGSPVK